MVAAVGGVRRQQHVADVGVVGERPKRAASWKSGIMRRLRASPGAASLSRSAASRTATDGSLVIAQRIVRVAAVPSGPATRSWTSPETTRQPPNGIRDHGGIRPIAAATSTPYGRRAGSGRSGCQTGMTPPRGRGRSRGARAGSGPARRRARPRWSAGRRHASLAPRRRSGRRTRHVPPGRGAGRRSAGGGEEAVDLGDVHPLQEVRVGGGVRRPVRHGADDPLVDRADDVDRLLGVLGGAEGRHREEPAGAREPAPDVAAVAGVLSHRRHRLRVERLQQHRPETAHEHRRVAVDARDRAAGLEPARAWRVRWIRSRCSGPAARRPAGTARDRAAHADQGAPRSRSRAYVDAESALLRRSSADSAGYVSSKPTRRLRPVVRSQIVVRRSGAPPARRRADASLASVTTYPCSPRVDEVLGR